jgi:hypothetical protein
MTENAPAPPGVMPTYADQILSALLVGGLQMIHGLKPDQVSAAAADIVSLIGLVYGLFAANPTQPSPVAFVLGLVRRSGQGRAYNAGFAQVEAVLAAKAASLARAEARQVAGPLLGPMAAPLAAKVAQDAVQAAAKAWLYPVG